MATAWRLMSDMDRAIASWIDGFLRERGGWCLVSRITEARLAMGFGDLAFARAVSMVAVPAAAPGLGSKFPAYALPGTLPPLEPRPEPTAEPEPFEPQREPEPEPERSAVEVLDPWDGLGALVVCQRLGHARMFLWSSVAEAVEASAELSPCDPKCDLAHDVIWKAGGRFRVRRVLPPPPPRRPAETRPVWVGAARSVVAGGKHTGQP